MRHKFSGRLTDEGRIVDTVGGWDKISTISVTGGNVDVYIVDTVTQAELDTIKTNLANIGFVYVGLVED